VTMAYPMQRSGGVRGIAEGGNWEAGSAMHVAGRRLGTHCFVACEARSCKSMRPIKCKQMLSHESHAP
jgi:hypothetical protein